MCVGRLWQSMQSIVRQAPSFGAPGEANVAVALDDLRGERGLAVAGRRRDEDQLALQAGVERFDNYRSGDFDVENTTPLFTARSI